MPGEEPRALGPGPPGFRGPDHNCSAACLYSASGEVILPLGKLLLPPQILTATLWTKSQASKEAYKDLVTFILQILG